MEKQITKILAYCPNPADATSYYRGAYPMKMLDKHYEDISVELVSHDHLPFLNWSFLAGFDLVFMQRPSSDEELILAQLCRINQIPLWVDYDDLLLDLPSTNPNYKFYNQTNVKANISEILTIASLVTVSTNMLGSSLRNYNSRPIIVPNAHNDYLYPWEMLRKPNAEIDFAFRGSNTHDFDVLSHYELIQKWLEANRYDHQKVTVWGNYNPLFSHPPFNIMGECNPPMDTIMFLNQLYNCNHAVIFFPLELNRFNLCKSNIAFLEATFTGGVVIGGVDMILCDYNLNQGTIIDIRSPEKLTFEKRYEIWEKSVAFIENNNLFLSETNKIRYNLIKKLVK